MIFNNPISINFLQKTNEREIIWDTLLHNDELEPPLITEEYFTFTDKEIIKEIITKSKIHKNIFGLDLIDVIPRENQIQLAFWSGDIGVYIIANNMEVRTNKEKIDINNILTLNENWWKYWEKYWKCKDTSHEYQKDYACEVIQPYKI